MLSHATLQKAPTVIGRAAETDAQRTSRLFNTLLDFGEPDLVLGGVHESLPHMRFFDMAMQRTSVVLTHMQDADALMRHAMRTGDMSLFKYLPAATLSACSVIAGPDRPTLQWPKAGAEARRREVANRAILQQWLLGMAPALYAALGPGPAALDMLPMLPSVTTPALRPVSRHLFSPEERVCVDGLVDTLLTLGLKYSLHIEEIGDDDDDSAFNTAENVDGRDKRTGAGAKEPPLQFRPQVHRLWHFRGLRQGATTRALPMAARQMVLHEAEMEGIRRSDAARQAAAAAAGVGPMEVDSTAAGATAAAQQHAQRAVVGHVPLDLNQRLREAGLKGKGVVIDAAPKRPGSWLDQMRDRQRAQRGGGGSAATGSGDDGGGRSGAAAMPVLYKFHEGYTNAVKRPIRMTELLA